MFSASRTTVSSHLARLVLIESDTYLWEKLGQNTSRALGGVGWGERVFEPLVEFVLTLKHVTSVIVSLSSHPLWCVDQKPSERGSYFFSWIRRSVLLTIYMLFASWGSVWWKTVTDVLKMLPEAVGRGQHFQGRGHSISSYGPTLSR